MPNAANAATTSGLAPSSSKRVLEKKVELAAWPGRTTGMSSSLLSSGSCCLDGPPPRAGRPPPRPPAPPMPPLGMALPLLPFWLLAFLHSTQWGQSSLLCQAASSANAATGMDLLPPLTSRFLLVVCCCRDSGTPPFRMSSLMCAGAKLGRQAPRARHNEGVVQRLWCCRQNVGSISACAQYVSKANRGAWRKKTSVLRAAQTSAGISLSVVRGLSDSTASLRATERSKGCRHLHSQTSCGARARTHRQGFLVPHLQLKRVFSCGRAPLEQWAPPASPAAVPCERWLCCEISRLQGAQCQKPRKIPLRIEPKTYFGKGAGQRVPRPLGFPANTCTFAHLAAANERTFLAWLGMATTLGTVSTAIAGFAVEDSDAGHKGGISQGTVELITLTLLPVSIAMIAYALFTFYWRSEFIRRKQVGFFDDKVGAGRLF